MDIKEIGVVKDIKKSIVTIKGFSNCMNGQLVDFESGARGIIMGFDKNESSVLVFAGRESIKPKAAVTAKTQNFMVPVGEALLSRIIDPLGEPLDRKGPIENDGFYPVFEEPAGVLDREPISQALETGIMVIDTVIPLIFQSVCSLPCK